MAAGVMVIPITGAFCHQTIWQGNAQIAARSAWGPQPEVRINHP
jgi:hypothetical protein